MARKKEKVSREGAKVYSYIRVSTEMQVERYSLDAQRDRIKKEAEIHGMEIVREYADEGRSGKNVADRPAFLQMMDDIKEGKDGVAFVLVYKLSRFGRKTSEVLQYIEFMQDYGVNLICVEDCVDTSSDMGKFMMTVLGLVAEMERENILDQTMEGRRRKAREGKWNGGLSPYGYEAVDDRLEVVPAEAEVVRIIFEKFTTTTMEQTTLARWLNEAGYKKTMKRPHEVAYFTPRFITRVLRNPVYTGMMAYGKTISAPTKDRPKYRKRVDFDEYDIAIGAHEAIVSEEVWQAAQDKLNAQSGKNEKREKEHEYLLGSLLRCPQCGRPMYGRPGRGKGTNKYGEPYPTYYSYMCRDDKAKVMVDGEKCRFGQIACHKVDNQVRDILMAITTAENFGETMSELAHEQVDSTEVENLLDTLKQRLRSANFRRDKLEQKQMQLPADRFFEENYDRLERQLETIYGEISETVGQIKAAEERLEAIKETALTRESIYEGLTVFSQIYDKLSDYEKKTFFRSFIERIDLYPDKNRKDGCYVKSIDFLFPVSYNGKKTYRIEYAHPESSAPSKTTVETVCLLSKLQNRQHIEIELNMDELDVTDADK